MYKLERIVLILCLLIIFSLTGYTYFLTQKIKIQEIRMAELESKYNESKTEIDGNSDEISSYVQLMKKLELDYSSRKKFKEEPLYINYKSRIQSLLDKEINDIVSSKPLHGGKWFVSKISFIGPTFALVEYEDGHDLFTLLIQIVKTNNGYSFKKIEGT